MRALQARQSVKRSGSGMRWNWAGFRADRAVSGRTATTRDELTFRNAPIEKQTEGNKANAGAQEADRKPYTLRQGRGLDWNGRKRARERQAEAYRGLEGERDDRLRGLAERRPSFVVDFGNLRRKSAVPRSAGQ